MLAMMGTLSAAISLRNQHSGSFSLQQKSKDPAVRHGPSALAKVYRKYGISTPIHDEVTVNSIRDDIITPTPNDKDYLTPVTIGGQTLNLRVDTGSSDLWVFSPLLPTAEQRGHKIYDPSLSNTSKALANDTWEIIYGDGSQGASGGGMHRHRGCRNYCYPESSRPARRKAHRSFSRSYLIRWLAIPCIILILFSDLLAYYA